LVTTPTHFLPKIKAEIREIADCIFAHGADKETVAKLLETADAWICSPCPTYLIDGDLLSHGKKLKIIATPSTGSNHIDRIWCEKNSIPVSCLKDSEFVKTILASSEFTWALLMATMRKLPLAVDRVKQGFWRDIEDELRAVEFNGKTLGIIGYGRIGSNNARYAKAFGMRILAFDPYQVITDDSVEQLATAEGVLKEADVVLISVHLDKTTDGMVDQSWFAQMKTGVVFINVSRGEIVNEGDLLANLESGQISVAGLDVISEEFLSEKRQHPVIKYAMTHDNLIVTPHIAGLTYDSEYKAARFSFDNIVKTLKLTKG
jgi:D-3-phosphoglycerate dehydrogenase / 2-oxoglutarate reductase